MKEVRLVGDNVQQGVVSIEEALRIADQLELDLVEISPSAVPPVCKVVDYQKFLYQQRKRERNKSKDFKSDCQRDPFWTNKQTIMITTLS